MVMNTEIKRVLVTGGAGYVGAVLVPNLVKAGYAVTVLDTFWFWNSPEEYAEAIGLCCDSADSRLILVKGDLRSTDDVLRSLQGVDTVIHLACISNDPSSELNAAFTHSVNYDGSLKVIDLSKVYGVKRFIYASSSSVYGVKREARVTEDLVLEPLTQYSQLKVEIEHYLLHRLDDSFQGVIIRPSTVCGYSPRQRLDVVVNILTNLAFNKGKITVFGGDQLRPNIHIKDMVRLYELLLEIPISKINRKVYNAGYENLTVKQIASLVQETVGKERGVVEVEIKESNDLRSYQVCSDKIAQELGFVSEYTVKDAIEELVEAFKSGKLSNVDDEKYVNMKRMKTILLVNKS